jgi:hypothetical protein
MADEQTGEKPPTPAAPDKVKKISIVSLGGGRKPSDDEQKNGGAFLGLIFGEANGGRVVESTDQKTGEVVAYDSIIGEFYAKKTDGTVLGAATLYLPGGFHEAMLDVVMPKDAASGERKNSGATVTFAFEVYTVAATNKSGFSYTIRPLIEEKSTGGSTFLADMTARTEKARAERQRLLIAGDKAAAAKK